MHLQKLLADLYRSEINVSIPRFWDGGWTVKLGDDMNGFKAERVFDNGKDPNCNFNGMAVWLANQAVKYYPESEFAKDFTGRNPVDDSPMSDEDGYIIEAALACGFTMINDDGDVFGATQEQVIKLAKRGKEYGMRLALKKAGIA